MGRRASQASVTVSRKGKHRSVRTRFGATVTTYLFRNFRLERCQQWNCSICTGLVRAALRSDTRDNLTDTGFRRRAVPIPHYWPCCWFSRRIDMRNLPTVLAATAFVIMGALAPLSAQSQQPKSTPAPVQQPPQAQEPAQQAPGQQAPAAPEAYKPVAVQLPKPLADPSFETFRKQLVATAQKKDRAGLGRLVAQNFFWVPEDQDAADKSKSGIENLSKAIGLEGGDASGWELLATFANEPTADPSAERPGVVCAPGERNFDENAAEELLNSTQTDPSEWGYPTKDGIEVRAEPSATSAVV